LACLLISKKLQIVPGILRALNGMALMMRQTGNLDEANTYLEKALQVTRDAGASASHVGSVLTNLAIHAFLKGDHERALTLHEEASGLFLEAGDDTALAWSLNHRGDVARKRKDFAEASRLYTESLATFRKLRERLGIAGCLHDLAGLAAETGNHDKAAQLNSEALSLYATLDHKADMPRVLDALACSAAASGKHDRALTLAGSAAAIRQSLSLYSPEASQAQVGESLDVARQHMTGAGATESWMAGWGMQPNQAIAFALAGQEHVSSEAG
jgi:tetratricopeptide (TPR) repeat protein